MNETELDNNRFTEIAAEWDHAHRYSPAPRHRRYMILRLLKNLQFSDCLDAGCAQPYLLQSIMQQFKVKGYGCDISTTVVKDNTQREPACEFALVNLEKETWPGNKRFDLVVSSEVIEHIPDWKSAVNHIAQMSKKYLLITVPSGKIRKIDQWVGHHRHFNGDELVTQLESQGFHCIKQFRHGFPVHSLYKRLINTVAPDKIYQAFDKGKPYTVSQKIISQVLYGLFFLNYLFTGGDQVFVLAERV